VKAAKLLVSRLVKGEEGVSLLEYGLLAALIAAVCITVVTGLGTKLNTELNNVNSKLP
jgi:pilus assembly protein Flp/PilA